MSLFDDDFFEPPRVVHRPLQPPRRGTPGEEIYLALWQEFATQRPREWFHIFQDMRYKPRQRAATVAASFMTFMGCNGGAGFTHFAETLAKDMHPFSRERAFIAAWAIENTRHRGINHGLRMIEYMLAREHPIEGRIFGRGVAESRVPVVTMEDEDVVECMVKWWSGNQAACMREIAEPARISAQRRMLWESQQEAKP